TAVSWSARPNPTAPPVSLSVSPPRPSVSSNACSRKPNCGTSGRELLPLPFHLLTAGELGVGVGVELEAAGLHLAVPEVAADHHAGRGDLGRGVLQRDRRGPIAEDALAPAQQDRNLDQVQLVDQVG